MESRIALVTGANRGIGFECVRQLCAKGYRTILTSRKEEDGQKALSQLSQYNHLLSYHQLDVVNEKSVQQLKNDILQEFGRLDILINNAGVNYDTWQQAVNADLKNVMDTIDTNLMGPWRMAKAFIPSMQKQGYGRIVNVSSGAGAIHGMQGGTPGYGISKAALNVLSIKLGKELMGTGILVNSVCPGWVRTDMGGTAAPRSVAQGAETIVWAAELPDDGPTSKFFRDKREIAF